MIFGGIQKTSTLDFPGILCCVVFTKGCNMNCFYCHNRALADNSASTVSEEEVYSFLNNRKGLLDGVVVSGGEPTLQHDLIKFISDVKDMKYKVKLDTNGLRPDAVRELLDSELLDYAAVDYKAPSDIYESICGAPADSVHQTISLLMKSGVPFEVRTTIYPGMTAEELLTLLSELPYMPCYRLNFFRMPEKYDVKDRQRLNGKVLRFNDINNMLDKILSLQPNLCEL